MKSRILKHTLLAMALLCALGSGQLAHAQSLVPLPQTEEAAQAEPASQSEAADSTPETDAFKSGNEFDPEKLSAEYGVPARILDPDIDKDALGLRLLPLTEPELGAAAAAWQQIVKGQTEEVVDASLVVNATEGDLADSFRERVGDLVEERRALFEKFMLVVTDWEKKGGDEDLIEKYRLYRSSILIDEIRKADAQTLYQRTLKWMEADDGGVELAIDSAVVIGSLFLLFIGARVVRRVARRWIARIRSLSNLFQAFLVAVFYWLTIVLGLMFVLSVLGVDVTPMFALLGGASFILAFALQETIANFFSGLMIVLNKPFDEGDYVDLEGVANGTVRKMNLISTTIITIDNQVISVPNNRVWNSVVTNVTASATRRVDMVFGIAYSDNIDGAMAILRELVEAHPLAMKDPEPKICVGELGAHSVNLLCRPWAKTADYWTLYWDMQHQVKDRFDAAGITIPFPQQSLHIETPIQLQNA